MYLIIISVPLNLFLLIIIKYSILLFFLYFIKNYKCIQSFIKYFKANPIHKLKQRNKDNLNYAIIFFSRLNFLLIYHYF